jgi:hypothetical protein
VPAASPAYISVFYHRMRLGNALDNYPEVRRSIDAFLASSAELPSVVRDFLLDLRLDAAADLNDAVRFLSRASCTVDHREPPPNCWLTMPEHPARYLDALPLDLQMEVLRNKSLAGEEKGCRATPRNLGLSSRRLSDAGQTGRHRQAFERIRIRRHTGGTGICRGFPDAAPIRFRLRHGHHGAVVRFPTGF